MAKAMEDTLFYRHNRLLAANEVGGEPDSQPGGISEFHLLMKERARLQPLGLSATSTHDTKRGEDARTRLYALSEEPELWTQAVERWQQVNQSFKTELTSGLAPDPNIEWMLYQALLGIWPGVGGPDATEPPTARFFAFAEKAIREAKLETSWGEPNAGFEDAVRGYAIALTSSNNVSFREDFSKVAKPFFSAGYLNSLSQTLIKLTAPGVPDIYQGAEAMDFSLVDPDNRRPLDTEGLSEMISVRRPLRELSLQAQKQRVVEIGLNLRKRMPDLFAKGEYLPIEVIGLQRDHVLAFARFDGADYSITIVPRLMLANLKKEKRQSDVAFWADTAVKVPELLHGRKRDLITGRIFENDRLIRISDILGDESISLMVAMPD